MDPVIDELLANVNPPKTASGKQRAFLTSTTEISDSNRFDRPHYTDELKALATLRDDGIITEEEFQKQKAEILERE